MEKDSSESKDAYLRVPQRGFNLRDEDEGTLSNGSWDKDGRQEMDPKMNVCSKSSHWSSNKNVSYLGSYSLQNDSFRQDNTSSSWSYSTSSKEKSHT